ncbi:MAG TPA: phosphoadenylyl-sulfate reductase, partial [Thermoleophilia bacterium]
MMTTETVSEILAELPDAPPEAVLAAAAARFPGRIAFASSLGLEDQVLTAMIAESGLDIPIFTLDTGRLFPETYDLIDRTSKRYGVTLHTYFPAAVEVEKMVDRDGVNLFRDSIEARKRCCEIRKVLPMRRAQIELDAWVCGLRAGQGATRQQVEVAEWDSLGDMVKINPLAAWNDGSVWDY